MSSHEAAKGPRLTRNDRIWDSMKEDIRRIYLTENETLARTMTRIGDIHGFSASPRKWKMKLEDWKFNKKSTRKRLVDEPAGGGDTTVSCPDDQSPTEKGTASKRRKFTDGQKKALMRPDARCSAQSHSLQPGFAAGASEFGSTLNSAQTQYYDAQAAHLGVISHPNSQPSMQDISPVATSTAPTRIREAPKEVSQADVGHGRLSLQGSVMADMTSAAPFSIAMGDSASHILLPNSGAEELPTLQQSQYPTSRSRQQSPTPWDIVRTLAKSPTCGLDTWRSPSIGADSFLDVNFDTFLPLSYSPNLAQVPDRNVCGEWVGLGISSRSSGFTAPDRPAVFEAAAVGGEMLPEAGVKYNMVGNLPYFQLLEAIENPESVSASFFSIKIIDQPDRPSRCVPRASSSRVITQPPSAISDRSRAVFGFLIPNLNSTTEISTWDLTTHLKQVIPERKSGDLENKVQQMLELSGTFPAVQMFQLMLYFSSNNLISEQQTDSFLEWAIHQKHTEILIAFLEHPSPTIRAFASRILESTVRIREPELLRQLLESSVDPRILSGASGGKLLTTLCNVSKSEDDEGDCQKALSLVKVLLEYGADLNYTDEWGRIPLFEAVENNNRELVELLIKAGADVNQELGDADGNTVLAVAIYYQLPSMVVLLLELGAQIENSFVDETPALIYAAVHAPGVYNIIRSNKQTAPGYFDVPGIIHASMRGNSFLAEYLQRGNGLSKTNVAETSERALAAVVRECHENAETLRLLQTLLELGVSANAPTQTKSCPLREAVVGRKFTMAQMLLKKGADVNARNVLESCATDFNFLELVIEHGANMENAGWALCNAARLRSLECIALLIESGANVNSRGYGAHGHPTPLQYLPTGYIDQEEMVETAALLIDYGANVNEPASWSKGRTALQAAAEAGSLPLVRYFLETGADVNAAPATVDGLSALEAAAACGSDDKKTIFHLLVEAGARLNRSAEESKSQATTSTLHALLRTKSNGLARYAITAGADINLKTCGKEGRTPLQLAAEMENFEIGKLLLEKGAKVNAPAAINFGRTALQAAAFCEIPQTEMVKLFLEKGAEVNAKPAIIGGVTALQATAIRGNVPLALLLLEAGADVNAKPAVKDGRTAIEGAAEHGRLDMFQLLIDAGAIGDVRTGLRKAIDAAERNFHFVVADMLKEHQETLDLFPDV